MKFCVLTMAVVGLLAGCASHQARDRLNVQDPTVLESGLSAQQSVEAGAPTKEWFATHQSMHAKSMLPDLEQRLTALGSKRADYEGAKAQCWLEAADEEYKADNQWGFVQEAMGEADRLISGLEGKQALSSASPKLRTVSEVRPDLRTKLASAKKAADGKKNCDEQQRIIACGEVALMHAGHEAWRRNFDKSEKRVNALAASLNDLSGNIDRCAAPTAKASEPATRTLKADALFLFDRGDEDGLLPEGVEELDHLAAELKQVADLQRIEIVGYTDRLGGDAYNDRLSVQRATTVKHRLQADGLTAMAIDATGKGKRDPVVQCDQRDRAALIECLAVNRRVEVRLFTSEL